jgi:hypothetical protein
LPNDYNQQPVRFLRAAAELSMKILQLLRLCTIIIPTFFAAYSDAQEETGATSEYLMLADVQYCTGGGKRC